MSLMEEFEQVVRAETQRQFNQIEEACEISLQQGKHGVLVVTGDHGSLISAEPDSRVPYGHIYYVPVSGLDSFSERNAESA